jgi:tRNA dimethylallyltransferase
MQKFFQLAVIGPTASGKTALAVDIAEKYGGAVLSLDSLSIYREIDIVSAKPTAEERRGIAHFGIDVIRPDEHFDVTLFAKLYEEARSFCIAHQKPLVIVGGTSFYLKTLIEGISPKPPLDTKSTQRLEAMMHDLDEAYALLRRIDASYAERIAPSDRYRIQKGLEIYFASGSTPTAWFATHPPEPIVKEALPIYEIVWERDILRQRIRQRTKDMLENGLIDEIAYLEAMYTRKPNCMKAIGIKETLDYLDGRIDKATLIDKISVNTARLAKRQSTFNRTQFNDVVRGDIDTLKRMLL